jgi:hypothetical protein
MILFFWKRFKWKPRPELPRTQPVSVLDEIIHDDWFKPKQKRHGNNVKEHTTGTDQG